MFFIGRCRVEQSNLSTLFYFVLLLQISCLKIIGLSIMKRKIIVGITGASGAIYAKVLLDKLKALQSQVEKVGVVMSDNAKHVWEYELHNSSYNDYNFDFYDKNNFM